MDSSKVPKNVTLNKSFLLHYSYEVSPLERAAGSESQSQSDECEQRTT